MEKIVFYSWQSDLPNSTNRGFIQEVLETAAASIAADETIAVQPVIDRDTKGVAGTPDIAATIFAKITAADIFVADVSIIGVVGERPTPNPNVMMELGYAVKALGWERVLLVFNEVSGAIGDLPFDLRGRRLAHYRLAQGATKAEARKVLGWQLDAGLRAALSKSSASEPAEKSPTTAQASVPPSEPPSALVVSHSMALVANTPGQQIMIEAANRDSRPRRIVSVGFQADNGKQLAFIGPQSDKGLPCVLHETEAGHFWLPITAFDGDVHQGIGSAKRIRPFVRDSYDEKHFGKWSEVSAESWLRKNA